MFSLSEPSTLHCYGLPSYIYTIHSVECSGLPTKHIFAESIC